MTSYCTIHQTDLFESRFEGGTPYHYISGDKALGICHGEGLGKAVRNGRAKDGQFNHQVQPLPKLGNPVNSMYMCNALNNATAMVNAGTIKLDNLKEMTEKLYKILETTS